jgi:hypothetical protein
VRPEGLGKFKNSLIKLGHETQERRYDFLSADGLFRQEGSCVNHANMLQGVMIHPALQFIPDASRFKVHFLIWRIL